MHYNLTSFYKKGVLLLIVTFYFISVARRQQLLSPDRNIEVIVHAGRTLSYDVKYKGQSVLSDNRISIALENGMSLEVNNKVISKKTNATT